MYKKILLAGAALLSCSQSFAAWEFRGEPNAWGITPLIFLSGDRHFTRQTFSATQDEFKITKDGSWATSFPAQNFVVTPGKTYDISFFEGNKVIQAEEVPVNENWVFRGTSNNWGLTPMVKSGNVFTICQNFAADDPRFRVSNGNKGSWVEAYPATDFRVAANTSFDITFTPATRAIQVTARASACGAAFVVNTERSLIVRDEAMLNISGSSGPVFSLDKVLSQLAVQLNGVNPTRLTSGNELFARLWDTQNPPPGFIANGPKCTGTLNGFSHRCRPVEGVQAQTAADFVARYRPIALVNRFDLRDKINFQDCGENRIVYALTSPEGSSSGRNFIIFEARLPNPQPGVAAGCAPIANFWKNLTTENNDTTRAQRLRDFYFNGLPAQNIRPVLDIRNFALATGQIRTNQFMSFDPWVLKEFKIVVENGLSIFKPVSVKANPTGFQFNDRRTEPLSSQFRSEFLNNMSSLLVTDLSTFSLTVQNDANNNGQSHASGDEFVPENNFQNHSLSGTGSFRSAIQSRAVQLGSTLTTTQVINRATAMTCGGCHMPDTFQLTVADSVGPGQTWPKSLGFTHVSETKTNGKFDISPALLNVFLPARKRDLEAFINSSGPTQSATAGQSSSSGAVLTGRRSG